MGKVRQPKKTVAKKPAGPPSLTLQLYAPGMTLLHRAGLGGLAATLRAMERRHRLGRLRDDQLPKGPDLGGGFPWRIDSASLTLDWGQPTAAREYLRKLFAFAFGIKDKLIDLPGTYRDELSRAVRAELQLGLMLAFLQHGNTRTVGDRGIQFYDPTGDGLRQIAVGWRPCESYRHQGGAEDLTTNSGQLRQTLVKIVGPLYPGAAVRHNEFASATKIEEPVARALPLYFAAVGCLPLAVRDSVGVLLVPDVIDLVEFARVRPRLTPSSSRECRIAGAADAAFQAVLRVVGIRLIGRHRGSSIKRIHVMRLAPQPWDKKQKYRDATVDLARLDNLGEDEQRLRQFELAMSHLPRDVPNAEWEREHEVGRGKDSTVRIKTVESFGRTVLSGHLWQTTLHAAAGGTMGSRARGRPQEVANGQLRKERTTSYGR